MEIGVAIFPTDRVPAPARVAAEAEARGLESVWFPEHTHIPTSRRTPAPAGEPLPEHYRRTLDPFVAIASAATVTSTLKLATGICLVAQRDPIITAKEVASVDYVSDGRFLFGIGVGWNVDEMEHHGVDPKRRRALVRENVLAMKALWTQDEASFDGEMVSFSPSWSWPKPVRRPYPPIVMGGAAGPRTFAHIVEYCDGWMPIHGRSDAIGRLPELRARAEAAGRDPATIELSVFGTVGEPALAEDYARAGFRRLAVSLPQDEGEEGVLRGLDRAAALVGKFA
jgi:probable F420-dependent oxidoreductase